MRDKAGFYVNRILAPYINEAIRMLTEGERVEHIDAALVKFGFPVGPIQLLDEVGIDTGTKIIPVLEAAYGERFSAPANVVSSILNDDRKGRKNGRGFYLYGQKGRKSKKQVDPAISRWTVPLYRFSRRGRSGCNNATTCHAVWFPFYPLRAFGRDGRAWGKFLENNCN